MSRKCRRILALLFPLLLGMQAAHGQDQKPLVKETKSRAAGCRAWRRLHCSCLAPFRSPPGRRKHARLTELALDKYESVLLDDAIVQAKHATEKDPNFALGYAVLSFAARRNVGNATALARAKALLPQATPDEQLMVRWMTSIQERNLLPAIASMNDLLKRYPKNKHVLYLTSEWLYTQQDFEHSQKMMESLLQLDPNFPPVLNMLGYSYIEAGHPDPAKAVASLKRYIELEPSSPNPEDSLGEVLRYAGDDQGSLEHYSLALQIDPTFFTSQLGLGDTLTLMGQYDDARLEYDKAMAVSENKRDFLHAAVSKSADLFLGRPSRGRPKSAGVRWPKKPWRNMSPTRNSRFGWLPRCWPPIIMQRTATTSEPGTVAAESCGGHVGSGSRRIIGKRALRRSAHRLAKWFAGCGAASHH